MPTYVIKAVTNQNVEYLVDSTKNLSKRNLIVAKLTRDPRIKNCWVEINYEGPSTLH